MMKQLIVFLQMMVLVVVSATGQVTYSSELEKKAQAGDAQAMADLGYCYAFGKGVQQDYSKAFEWYRKTADLGDADAMFMLSTYYRFGLGTTKDLKEAEYWLKKAQEMGSEKARRAM